MMVLIFLAGAVVGGLAVNAEQANLHTWLLIGVMLAGGMLGGGVNFLLAKADEPPDAPPKANITTSLLAGVLAAFLVPLFLQMLSSDLLNRTKQEPLAVLIFLGFCLIASVSSRAFITTISDRILRAAREAENSAAEAKEKAAEAKQTADATAGAVEPILEKETEPQTVGSETQAEERAGASQTLGEQEKSVLMALASQKYTLRSASGVTRDSGLPDKESVVETLKSLMGRNLVGLQQSKKGNLWFLTTSGWSAVRNLRGDADQ